MNTIFRTKTGLHNCLKKAYRFFIMLCCFMFTCTHFLQAQCTTYDTAVEGMVLTPVSDNDHVRTSLAYNPQFNLYYSASGGKSRYGMDTYSATGVLLATVQQNFDYRGMWWNPNTAQLEANGYARKGIGIKPLDPVTGYPLPEIITAPGMYQPTEQSCGAYDPEADIIFYYYNKAIYTYSRKNGAFLGSGNLNSIPVTMDRINNFSVVFTGCKGKEIGIYDYADRRVFLYNKINLKLTAIVQLPLTAASASIYRVAYTNNLFWLYKDFDGWHSYKLFTGIPSPAPITKNNKDQLNWQRALPKEEDAGIITTIPNQPTTIAAKTANAVIIINPNPVKDVLHMQVYATGNYTTFVQISNVYGQVNLNIPLSLTPGKNEITIPVSALQKGTYILSMLQNKQLRTVKFIKE